MIKIEIKDERIKLGIIGWIMLVVMILFSFCDTIIMNYMVLKIQGKGCEEYRLEEGTIISSYNISRKNAIYKVDIKYKDTEGNIHIATMHQRWDDKVGKKVQFYVEKKDSEVAWWNKMSVARLDSMNFLAVLLFAAALFSRITGKRISIEEVIAINNKKTILAEVILVDNLHNPKKLICQEKRADGTVIQYKKEKKWGNFKEKPGEYVAVDVNEKNERQYEIFER